MDVDEVNNVVEIEGEIEMWDQIVESPDQFNLNDDKIRKIYKYANIHAKKKDILLETHAAKAISLAAKYFLSKLAQQSLENALLEGSTNRK